MLLLLGSFAFTHLMAVPAIEDEGSQLRWIWRVIEAGEWLQPLGEGKPLEAWPMVPVAMLAPHALAAIRALHVLCGIVGALLTYWLAAQVTGRLTALASGVLFVTCPFVVYLQRFALSDILLCTAGIWVLLCVVRLVAAPSWPRATALAVAVMLAALSKLPVGFVFLTATPLALLMMPRRERRALLQRPAAVKVLAAHVPAVALALAVIVIAVVRTQRGHSPGFGLQDFAAIGLGRHDDIGAVIGLPRPSLLGELTAQLSWPVVVLGLIGLAVSALLDDWRQRWLIVVGAAPMLAIGWLPAFWFSRYLLFALPPLIVAAASGWHGLSNRLQRIPHAAEFAVFGLCAGLMGYQSARLVLDPLAARWSPVDRFQYFEGWGSGYGYPEAAQFLLETSNAPRMIYALDGHSAYQLRTYLPTDWRARVRPVFYGEHGELLRGDEARLANLLSQEPVWIIVSPQLLPLYTRADFGVGAVDRLAMRQVAEFAKPGSRAQLAIYDVRLR
jgi:hypothetical protein